MTHSDNLGSLDLTRLREAYSSGRCSPEQVVRAVYARIAAAGEDHVWTYIRPLADALATAREVTATHVGGHLPALYGIPFGVKDNVDVAGVPTTAAFGDLGPVPEVSAAAVAPLLAAGAIFIGKTNLDQFATGLSGTRSPFGTPVNPLDRELVPGGSSSGSAVAVSAGLVSFAVGTDTAGSGRVPAALNNIVGIKPSRGWVSIAGIVPACPSLDCPSVFALTVRDATEITTIMATGVPTVPAPRPLAGLHLAVPADDDLGFDDSEEGRAGDAAYRSLLARLVLAGVVLEPIGMTPLFEAGRMLYEGAWVAERYAAIRPLAGENWPQVHPIVRAVVEAGPTITGVEVFADQRRIAEIQHDLAPIFHGAPPC